MTNINEKKVGIMAGNFMYVHQRGCIGTFCFTVGKCGTDECCGMLPLPMPEEKPKKSIEEGEKANEDIVD